MSLFPRTSMTMAHNGVAVKRSHKVVLMGSSAVGKTSIAIRFSKDSFSPDHRATIGAAFIACDIDTSRGIVPLHIWDTAGQELYRSLVPKYSHGAVAVVIVFDVTEQVSFEEAKDWLSEARANNASRLISVLVANKCDLDPGFDLTEAKEFAESEGMMYIESSAKLGKNVSEIFQRIAESVALLPVDGPGVDLTDESQKDADKKGCC